MKQTRKATTHWHGSLTDGSGHTTLDTSGAAQFDVSWPRRSESAQGVTSPEELIAAAHASCLSMNLAGVLGKEGLEPQTIHTVAEVTFEKTASGPAITGIHITLHAQVDGVDSERFAELASTAEKTCPVSKALAGTTITLDAALAG